MAHQYRHVIPANPDGIVCDHRMFDLLPADLNKTQCQGLVAVLNSTWIGLAKTFYGRYTGTEGSLDTEVIYVELIDVPIRVAQHRRWRLASWLPSDAWVSET